MRKTAFITTLLAILSITASAQDYTDAYKLSKSDYEGTARTVAMGNAFTALGGDLGAVTINPASLAVSQYSQWTITPGISIAVNTATGSVPSTPEHAYFQKNIKNTLTRFGCPNVGASFVFDMHHNRGVKNITLGLVYNRTASYADNVIANGTNTQTSFMGEAAAAATGINFNDLNAENAWELAPWKSVVAWKSGMITNFGGFEDQYVGTSESVQEYIENGQTKYDIHTAGMIDQSYTRLVTGHKDDFVFNLGMNISDEVYIGANFGITILDYVYDDIFGEKAIDPKNFELDYGDAGKTYFQNMKYKYAYTASGTGFYGKFGIIWAPKSTGIRVGAAIKTPTLTTIHEMWQIGGETKYTDSKFNMSAHSPQGEFTYRLREPFNANFGLAYTFGRIGVISADYELCDYTTMRLKDTRASIDDIFYDANQNIKQLTGLAHKFRIGAEVKPIDCLAIRAGYGLETSGLRYFDELDRKITPKNIDHNFAFGLGYSSPRSFFMDIAAQARKYSTEYIYPYNEYIEDIPSPEIINKKTLWNVYLTLGLRF